MTEDKKYELLRDNLLENIKQNPGEIEQFLEQNMQFQELMMMYRCAIREVQTKLEVLNDEFKTRSQRNPIDSIHSRVKSPISLMNKMHKRGFPFTIDSILQNIDDVAGVRVVCPFIDDIYQVANMLITQDDIEVVVKKDYIQNPKENGYRSLHYVVKVPIFLSDKKHYMKVEVQIRTIAMNFWASLEHQIHYKKFGDDEMPEIVEELTKCAETIYESDMRMQKIRNKIEHKVIEENKLALEKKGESGISAAIAMQSIENLELDEEKHL